MTKSRQQMRPSAIRAYIMPEVSFTLAVKARLHAPLSRVEGYSMREMPVSVRIGGDDGEGGYSLLGDLNAVLAIEVRLCTRSLPISYPAIVVVDYTQD